MEVGVSWKGEIRIKVGTEVTISLVGRALRVGVELVIVVRELVRFVSFGLKKKGG